MSPSARIGTRLFLLLSVPIAALMVLFAYLDQERSRVLLRDELAREGRAVARTLQLAMNQELENYRLQEVSDLVDQITGYERILGLRVFDRGGDIVYQSATLAEYPFLPHDELMKVLESKTMAETHRRFGDQPAMTFIAPLRAPDGTFLGAFQVVQLESFIEEDARRSRNAILILTILLVLATGLVIITVSRRSVSRPIEEMASRFGEVGAGDLSARVPVHRTDELGTLAARFNEMCARLQESQESLAREQLERTRIEARLRQEERLASLGRLAAGLAHEIGTPLNVIGGRADSLRREVSPDGPLDRSLRIISGQIDRISRIVRGMLDFARATEPRLAPTPLAGVVRKVVDLFEARIEQCGVGVELAAPADPIVIPADADQLQQVFINLLTNALDAMPEGGRLRIAIDRIEREAPPSGPAPGAREAYARVSFQDTGHGVEPALLPRVFDPFFTTKEVGKGTGLGLSVAYGIVREHGGWIDFESNAGRGSSATIYLPERAPAQEAGGRSRRAS